MITIIYSIVNNEFLLSNKYCSYVLEGVDAADIKGKIFKVWLTIRRENNLDNFLRDSTYKKRSW